MVNEKSHSHPLQMSFLSKYSQYTKYSIINSMYSHFIRQVFGELFAQTSKFHPFNIISDGSRIPDETSNAIASKEVFARDVSATSEIHPNANLLHPNSNVLQRLKERILKYVFQDQFF